MRCALFMAEREGFALACGLGQGRLCLPLAAIHYRPVRILSYAKTKTPHKVVFLFWRRERDSNPRVLAHKLISSQPRYDHFDISPYMIKLKMSLIFVIYLAGRPVMSCCGAQNLLLAFARKILTAATPFCSLNLPPAALANVPTSISLQVYSFVPISLDQNIISHLH